MTSKQPHLPQEVLPRSTKLVQIILTLLCPWLVFAVANIGAGLYLKHFPQNRGYWLIQQKWSMLLNLNKPADWLVLGDSSCNQGVVPEVLGKELAGNAVNLCTIGDSLALNDAWMVSKHIQEHGAPKNILIVHVYDMWDREIKLNVTSQTPLAWGYWNKLEPNFEFDLTEQKDVFLNKYVPLYSQSTSLKEVLKDNQNLFKGKDYHLAADGFMPVTEANDWNVEQDAKGHIKDTAKKSDFAFSDTNQDSINAIIDLAEKHDINVYLANSPLYEELYQNPDFRNYYDQVQQGLEKISDRSDKVKRILIEPMTFSKTEMENADHVIETAAKSYTEKLAQEIKQVSGLDN